MSTTARLLADPWLRGCAAAGAVMLAIAAIVGLPWLLWLAWAYVVVLSAWPVLRAGRSVREPSSDT